MPMMRTKPKRTRTDLLTIYLIIKHICPTVIAQEFVILAGYAWGKAGISVSVDNQISMVWGGGIGIFADDVAGTSLLCQPA